MTHPEPVLKCGTCNGTDGMVGDGVHLHPGMCLAEYRHRVAELQRQVEVAREAMVTLTRFQFDRGMHGESAAWNGMKAALADMPKKKETEK